MANVGHGVAGVIDTLREVSSAAAWRGLKEDTGQNMEKTGEAIEKAGEAVKP